MTADSIIFDLDGTLWDSTDVAVRAWNRALSRIDAHVTKDDIRGIMGLRQHEIAEMLLPGLDSVTTKKVMAECNIYECEMLRCEGGKLFDGLKETLQELYLKLPLFIVSNCNHGYIEAFLYSHDLGAYFRDFEFAGRTGQPKGENIKSVIERNNLKSPIYVGDTEGDREAATLAGIPFIFAAYGFGSTTDYDYIINSPEDLKKFLFI